MHESTAANLRSAYAGESMAHMRYLIWAGKAEEEGYPNVGRLLKAISRAEQVHATNHFQVMAEEAGDHLVPGGGEFGYRTTSENLVGAFNGEDYEVREMYPTFMEVAKSQQEGAAAKTFYYALETEKIHRDMFTKAKEAVDAGKDVEMGPVWICTVCGYTHEGDGPPEKCPICAEGPDKYVGFE